MFNFTTARKRQISADKNPAAPLPDSARKQLALDGAQGRITLATYSLARKPSFSTSTLDYFSIFKVCDRERSGEFCGNKTCGTWDFGCAKEIIRPFNWLMVISDQINSIL